MHLKLVEISFRDFTLPKVMFEILVDPGLLNFPNPQSGIFLNKELKER